jgi:hypothetical protein
MNMNNQGWIYFRKDPGRAYCFGKTTDIKRRDQEYSKENPAIEKVYHFKVQDMDTVEQHIIKETEHLRAYPQSKEWIKLCDESRVIVDEVRRVYGITTGAEWDNFQDKKKQEEDQKQREEEERIRNDQEVEKEELRKAQEKKEEESALKDEKQKVKDAAEAEEKRLIKEATAEQVRKEVLEEQAKLQVESQLLLRTVYRLDRRIWWLEIYYNAHRYLQDIGLSPGLVCVGAGFFTGISSLVVFHMVWLAFTIFFTALLVAGLTFVFGIQEEQRMIGRLRRQRDRTLSIIKEKYPTYSFAVSGTDQISESVKRTDEKENTLKTQENPVEDIPEGVQPQSLNTMLH